MFWEVLLGLSTLWGLWSFLRAYTNSTTYDNVPGPPSNSWLFGNFNQILNTKGWEFHNYIARTYGSVIAVKGFFGASDLYIFDPKALHQILVKDAANFEVPEAFILGNRMMFGEGSILSEVGERHRLQRKMFNPVFSAAHMRGMVPTFYEVTQKLVDTFHAMTRGGPREIDLLSWTTRLALELIGRGGLGFSFDSLEENSPPHRFVEASKTLVPASTKAAAAYNIVIPSLARIGTPSFRRFIVYSIPSETLKMIRDTLDIIHSTSVGVFESKKRDLAKSGALDQIEGKKDIMSILMKANMRADESERLSDVELLAQMNTLTFAATDTTSGALARIISLLAQHKGAQERLRKELRAARDANGGHDLSYDDLVSLPYLDAVCRETLRLYPPLTLVQRTARKDTTLALGKPIQGRDGSTIETLPVPKGTRIYVGIHASNRNPELWGPDAEEWRPQRWLEPLPEALIAAHIPGIYSHLLTFLGGGRSCIGFKFSQLEMKVALTLLLDNFRFSLAGKPIVWQMTGIVSPHTHEDSMLPSLPMVISRAAGESSD